MNLVMFNQFASRLAYLGSLVNGRFKRAMFLKLSAAVILTLAQTMIPIAVPKALAAQAPRVTFTYGDSPAGVSSLAMADVNGDGRKDFILGSVGNGNSGEVDNTYVIFNEPNMPSTIDLSQPLGSLGYVIADSSTESISSSSVGYRVTDAGDLNGDGKDDLLLYDFTNGSTSQGTYLIWGKSDNSAIDLASFTTSEGVYFSDASQYLDPENVGDINGDGIPDIAFGSPHEAVNGHNSDGQVHVVYGYGAGSWPAQIDLNNLSPSQGYQVSGNANSYTGASVIGIGDFNRDGIDDMAITAPDDIQPGPGQPQISAVYIIYGSSTSSDLSTSSLGSRGMRISTTTNNINENDDVLAKLGDVNGDGKADLAIAAAGPASGKPSAPNGLVWIVFGKSDNSEVDLDNLGTEGAHISESPDSSGAFFISSDSSNLFVDSPNATGPNGELNAGSIWGLPLSSLTSSLALPSPGVGFQIQNQTTNSYLGNPLSSTSADGEFMARVLNNSGIVAVVLPSQNADIQLPDTTAPTVTGSQSPAPNSYGWNNGNLTINWTATDPDSSATTPNPTNVTTEGANQVITSDPSCDPSSNCATGSVTVNIDKTAPTITYTVSPGPNSAGWNNTNVTVSFNCSDALSGIATCTSPIVLSNDGANQQATGTAVDKAGNRSSVTVSGINIDKTLPTVSSLRMSSTSFKSGAIITVSANAADAGSGVVVGEYFIDGDPGFGNGASMAYSNGTVSATNAVTGTSGTHYMYVRVKDAAGNWCGGINIPFTIKK